MNEKENPPEIKINNFIKYMKNGLITTGITSIYLLPIFLSLIILLTIHMMIIGIRESINT